MPLSKEEYHEMTDEVLEYYYLIKKESKDYYLNWEGKDIAKELVIMEQEIRNRKLLKLNKVSKYLEELVENRKNEDPNEIKQILDNCETKEDAIILVNHIMNIDSNDPS